MEYSKQIDWDWVSKHQINYFISVRRNESTINNYFLNHGHKVLNNRFAT